MKKINKQIQNCYVGNRQKIKREIEKGQIWVSNNF